MLSGQGGLLIMLYINKKMKSTNPTTPLGQVGDDHFFCWGVWANAIYMHADDCWEIQQYHVGPKCPIQCPLCWAPVLMGPTLSWLFLFYFLYKFNKSTMENEQENSGKKKKKNNDTFILWLAFKLWISKSRQVFQRFDCEGILPT